MSIVVLSGGNTAGSYQVGVLEYLSENHNIDIVIGNSIGAVNAFIWNYQGVEGLKREWGRVSKRGDFLALNWKRLFFDGIFHLSPLRKTLSRVKKEGMTTKLSYATVCKLSDGKMEYIPSTDMRYIDATLGSAAEPVFMAPVDNWVDGGIREFIPLDFALTLNSEKVFVVSTDTLDRNHSVGVGKRNLFGMLSFAVDQLTHEVALNDANKCMLKRQGVKMIKPDVPLNARLDFSQETVKRLMELGYNDAKRALK